MPDPRSLTVAGRLELPKPVFTAGDELKYVVVNTGDLPIMVGAAYILERFAHGEWRVVNPDAGFHAWGRRLAPGQQSEFTTHLPASLPAGNYRLRKRLAADRDPHPGYEWVDQSDIAPCEAIAELSVNAREPPRAGL